MQYIKLNSKEQENITNAIINQINNVSFAVDDRIIKDGDNWAVNIVIGLFDREWSGQASLTLPPDWHIPKERIKVD